MYKTILLFFICVSLLYAQRRIGIQISSHSKGVMIEEVFSHTPATQVVDCGREIVYSLEQGDIILAIEGEFVNEASVFTDKVKNGPPVLFLKVWDASASVVRTTAVPLGSEAEMEAYLRNGFRNNKKNQYHSRPNNQGFDVQKEIEWLNSQGIYVDPDAGKYDWLNSTPSTNGSGGASSESSDKYFYQKLRSECEAGCGKVHRFYNTSSIDYQNCLNDCASQYSR